MITYLYYFDFLIVLFNIQGKLSKKNKVCVPILKKIICII